jgi:ABC-2 type transport system ATP-binding protein
MEILEFVGLDKFIDRRAGQLSGGMKQKLGLASALVTRPRVLLLDEPTTGVDPVTRQDFWQLIIKLASSSLSGTSAASEVEASVASRPSTSLRSAQDGVSVVISTPYMDEASRCHRVGFMKEGKIIAEDTPSNLRARLSGRILALRGSPINVLRRVAHKDVDVEDVQAFGDRLHIRVGEGKAQAVLSRLKSEIGSAGGQVDELRIVPPVLEDVFIALSNHEYATKGVQA